VLHGFLREVCSRLASPSNSLKSNNIGKIDDELDYGECSYVTIEGTYQLTSVSKDVRVSSVDDVASTVSVLRENSNLGLHFTVVGILYLSNDTDSQVL